MMNASFRWLWSAAASSNLGDGITLTALPLLALAAGASPGQVGLVTVAATLAWPLFGLPAGWIVDRMAPGRLLILVSSARATALAILATSIASDVLVVPAALATALVHGIAETLVDTAFITTVPKVIDPRRLTSANARIETTTNIANLLAGPPVAGALIGVSGLLAAASGAGLYIVAALAALALGVSTRHHFARRTGETVAKGSPHLGEGNRPGADPHPAGSSSTSGGPDPRVRDGLVHLLRHPLQRELTLLTAAMSLIWAAWTAVFVLHAVTPGPLGLDSTGYGLLLAAMALGGIAASTATTWLQERIGRAWILLLDTIGTVGLALPAALGWPLPFVAAGIVLAGAGSSVWRIIVTEVRQRSTPEHLIGRVYSASRVISWGALPIGSALASLGAELIGVRAVFIAASALAALIVAWFLARWRLLSAPLDSFNQVVDKKSEQVHTGNQPFG